MGTLDASDPILSYYLGLLHTDGTHDGDIDHKGRVTIELAKRDEDVLQALSRALPLKTTIHERIRTTNFSGGKPYTCVSLSAYDRDFRRWLSTQRMPPGRKSSTVGPPETYSHRDYLRGVIDGDGSVGFTRTETPFISFVTTSQELAEFFSNSILMTSGKSRTLQRNSRDDVFNVMVVNVAAAQLAEYVWPSAGVFGMTRKLSAGLAVARWKPPASKAGRYGVIRRTWTPEQDAIVLATTDAAAALATGRTLKSISVRRWRLSKTMTRGPIN